MSPDVEVLRLLLTSLKTNDFIFHNEWYLQVGGTAMGKKFAPNYANIFMAQWEKEALGKCPKNPNASFDSYGHILGRNSRRCFLIFSTLVILI